MELFSEIYSCYYNAMSEIIDNSINSKISYKQMENIIKQCAFSESSVYIIPKIDTKQWSFFDDNNKLKIRNKTKMPLTKAQKMWLCAIFNDERINQFCDEKEILIFKKYFDDNNIKPLFYNDDFYAFDQFKMGDNYLDKFYTDSFKILTNAIKTKEIVKIYYNSSKNRRIVGSYCVFKIEYSKKNNRHRVYAMKVNDKNNRKVNVFNISRILDIEKTDTYLKEDIDFDKYVDFNMAEEPVILEISDERNALERCMVQLASYDKKTEFDKKSGKYLCYVYYNKDVETELLIQVLSFIPVVKVLGNKSFLSQVLQRVNSQKENFR